MSRSTNAIKLLAKAGIDALRGIEAVSILPETLHIATDPNDELWCPDCEAPPSPGLIQSMRNGWMEGSVVVAVNRGTKDAPIPFLVTGRSRNKAALVVNQERAKDGLDPIKVELVFCSADDAYSIMLIENNKQERSPLFNARRWQQHKRVVARRLGKASLNDAEKREARKEFAALIDVDESTINGWEKMLENPPEVLVMIDRGQLSPTDAKELVKHVPEAQRAEKAVELAARKSEKNGSTKKANRAEVLGKSRTFSQKEIRALTVGANKIGMDHDTLGKFLDENGAVEIDPIVAMSQADGFALFGRLVTGEIGIDDLPSNLRAMAQEVLNKK